MRSFIKKAIAIMLAAILFAELPMGEYKPDAKATTVSDSKVASQAGEAATGSGAEVETSYNYVSELRLFKTNGADKATVAEQARKDGWTIASDDSAAYNLNEYTERDGILLGYKTSTNRDDAITDIRMLEMGHGYDWFDYQRVAESQMDKIEGLAADLGAASVEFAKNLESNSRAAEFAKDFLNYLYFTDSVNGQGTHHNLGDFFASGKADQQTIKKLLIRANGGSLTAIYSQLALALSDTDKNWVQRIEETDPYTKKEVTSTELKIMDRAYYEYAMEMATVLKTFADGYRAAQNHKDSEGNVALAAVSGSAAGDELTDENTQNMIDAGNTDKKAPDLMYDTAYGILNKFTVGSESAGDYFLRLGEKTYTGRADYRALYPLVAALTNGQYGVIKVVGFAQMALNLQRDEAFYKELHNMRSAVRAKLDTLKTGVTQLNAYAGVNTEFYDRKVALTDEAYRESKAGTLYTELTREGEFYDIMNMTMTYIGLSASVSSLITGCISLGLLIAGSHLSVWAACAGAVGGSVLGTIGGVLGCAAVIVGYVALVALIVAAIVYLVKWIVDQVSDPEKEDYTEMPGEIYDLAQVEKNGEQRAAYVKYNVVTNSAGKAQDINADDGKRWNLLYYTKNKDLGTPLVVDSQGRAFIRTVNDANTPAGMNSIKCFGEKNASNLNSYTRKESASSLYMHFYTIKSLEDNGGYADININQGTEGKSVNGIDKSSYLFGLMVSHEKTESAAKAAILRKQGYHVYDRNLSSGEGYTYIGYATTKIKKDAIKDLRIVPGGASEVRFGEAGYTAAGKFDDGSTIMWSKYDVAGDPIYGGFVAEKKLLSPESGFEPVNMFCGGNAYDLNFTNDKKDPLYLYFQQEKSYTSGEKYIGGIQFVSVREGTATRDVDRFIKESGLVDYGVELVDHSIAGKQDKHGYIAKGRMVMRIVTGKYDYKDYKIRLCYSYTYNPKRAITDVGFYTATPRMESLQQNIVFNGGSYVVAENVLYSDVACLYANDSDSTRSEKYASKNPIGLVARNHSYVYPPKSSGGKMPVTRKVEDNITYTESYVRLQSLYQCGPMKNKQPLRVEDVKLSYDGSGMKGMHSVKRFTDPYSKPVDISYPDDKQKQAVYMYIRGAEVEKPKYISSIEIGKYSRPENTDKHTFTEKEYAEYDKMSDDDAIMKTIAAATGGVYNYNLAVPQQNAWYNNTKPTYNQAAYIGVNRTNSESHAITGIILLEASERPDIKIKVDGAEYHRVGDQPIGKFYMYYTKSPGANPGMPLTDLFFDGDPIGKGMTTVASISKPDEGKEKAVYRTTPSDLTSFIHMKADTNDGIISDMTIFNAKDQTELMTEMAKSGYNYVVNESLNRGTGGKPIYLAYKMCSEENIKKASQSAGSGTGSSTASAEDEDWSDFNMDFNIVVKKEKMIRDIVCVVGGTPEKTITHNGVKYDLVSDISLNEGESGRSIYLYATTEENVMINGKQVKLSPLSKVVACSGYAVPYREPVKSSGDGKYWNDIGNAIKTQTEKIEQAKADATLGDTDKGNPYGTWEETLDTNGDVVDMNDGVFNRFDDFKHVTDCRLYLFSHRYDQCVKPGAEINRGEVTNTFTVGNLYIAE